MKEAAVIVDDGIVIPIPARDYSPLTLWVGGAVLGLLLLQAAIVCNADPRELITGVGGIVDILHRATPPNWASLSSASWPSLVTFDSALLGTTGAIVLSLPLSILAARNTAPATFLYYGSRTIIAICRAIPSLIWALIFVTAVGLGPFAGVLGLAVHSIGVVGRLFAEVIEDIDMGPVEALTLTGARRLAVFAHAVVPGVAPSLLGIGLYLLDQNILSSITLGFVGAGGIGFQLMSSMSMFQYKDTLIYLVLNVAIVLAVERLSATLRKRIL